MKRYKHINKFIRTISALVLVFIILFNATSNLLQLNLHTHHNEEIKCASDIENDACHQFLVHHKKSEACNGSHKHFQDKSHECFACHYSFHASIYIPNSQNQKILQGPIETRCFYDTFQKPTINSHFDYTLRGPPCKI